MSVERVATVRLARSGPPVARDVPWIVKPYQYDPNMGEVRTHVTLTSAMDNAMARRGLISPQEVKTHSVDALVDTGAVRTVIPADVAEQLGLAIWKETTAEYADGRKELVGLTEPVLINVNGRETFDEAHVLGDEVLIGQTVLEKLDLYVDCKGQRLVPNPAHPDQAVSKVK